MGFGPGQEACDRPQSAESSSDDSSSGIEPGSDSGEVLALSGWVFDGD